MPCVRRILYGGPAAIEYLFGKINMIKEKKMKSKKKTFAFLSLLLALAMMCTLALTACKKDDDKDEDKDDDTTTTETGAALALVTDDALKDKFAAMYTFEGETAAVGGVVAAYDPYTGEAVPALNGAYTAAQTAEGVASKDATKSKTTLHEGSAFEIYTLGDTDFFPGELIEETDDKGDLTAQYIEGGSGISYSFWYNGATQSDWNKIVASSAAPEVNYGNLSFTGNTAYPSMGATVGRAAYTAESYQAAQDANLTATQLAKFSTTYNVYNAMCGEGAAEITEGMTIVDKAVATIGNEISNTWVYFTIVVEEDAISFYRNGILAYIYDSNVSAIVGDGVEEIYTNLYMDIVASLGAGYGMKFFGEGTSSIDDLLIGKELTYDEVTALYENMSGATVADADKELVSNVDPDEAARADAINAGVAELKAARLALVKAERDKYTAPATVLETVNAGWALAGTSATYSATVTDGKIDMTVKGTQVTPDSGASAWNLAGVAIKVNGSFMMYMRGDSYGQLTDDHSKNTNQEEYAGWNAGEGYSDYVDTDRYFAEVSMTVKYDGTALTFTWTAVPFDAGEEYTKEVTYEKADGTTGTATATYSVPASVSSTYTMPLAAFGIEGAVTSVELNFAADGCTYYITEVTGGTKAA